MSGLSGVVRTEYTTGRGQNFPVASTISAPPATPVFGVTPGQVSAVSTTTVTLTVPATTAGQFVYLNGSSTLTAWPQSLTLKTGQTAQVVASLSLGVALPQFIVGMPYVVLTFGSGTPLSSAGTGTSVYTLQPGRTYANPGVTFTLTAYCISTLTMPVTIPVSVGAVLFAQSA